MNITRTLATWLCVLCACPVFGSEAATQPADTTRYTVFMGSREAGVQLRWVDNDGTYGYYL